MENVTYIEGGKKNKFLRSLERDPVFLKNVNKQQLLYQGSTVIELGENDYSDEDVILITSPLQHESYEVHKEGEGLLYAFVQKDSKKVLKLAYFFMESDVVDYKDFDQNGTLMIHKEFNSQDFLNGKTDNAITHYSVYDDVSLQNVDKDSFWYKFVCGFSGLFTCNLGCAGFWAVPGGGMPLYTMCMTACQLFWGAGLC